MIASISRVKINVAMYENEINQIKEYVKSVHTPVIIAIDGRCASGKSTFGSLLQEALDANILRMDDFFLQPYQRTKERYATPGENVDHERVLEVIESWKNQTVFSYQVFDCQKMVLDTWVKQDKKDILIVEGSYSMHQDLLPYYSYTVFMTIAYDERLERIQKRNGDEKLKDFIEKWIPLEEKYFTAYKPEEVANIVINTSTKGE